MARSLSAPVAIFLVGFVGACSGAPPAIVHIENNPQKGDTGGNDGLAFATASTQEQQAYLRGFATAQRTAGYTYMFPVFFPLLNTGATQYSWNAQEEGLIPFMDGLMSR